MPREWEARQMPRRRGLPISGLEAPAEWQVSEKVRVMEDLREESTQALACQLSQWAGSRRAKVSG